MSFTDFTSNRIDPSPVASELVSLSLVQRILNAVLALVSYQDSDQAGARAVLARTGMRMTDSVERQLLGHGRGGLHS